MKILTITTFLFVFVTSVLSRSGLRVTGTYTYVTIDDIMYYIEDRRPIENYPTQPEALEICKGLDMDLPDIETAEKEAAIIGYLKTVELRTLSFWTSGFRGEDGRWMWTNLGREMTYVNWPRIGPRPGRNFAYYNWDRMVDGFATGALRLVICQEKPKGPGFTCKRRRRRALPA